MQTTKTFRLFISSTFNDFRREREVLQTEVFPEIKSYCAKKGYTFQPIDLRWGVTQEAQLDQKTLELCLNEVQTCKSYPYPNFLFMLGDRYGWIPLPYTIEENEFEEILSLADPNEQKLLLEWYQKDLNQLPPSYILKERRGEYEDFDKWRIVEDKIRTIFQKIVDKSSLSNSQKQKYFLSATEAEIIEGIIPYMGLTKHQKKLIQEDPNIQKVDVKYIFGFFRDIDKNSKIEDKFITNDYYKAQNLKQNLKKVLLKENILEVNTTQLSENNLDETYLKEFKTRVKNFLIEKIDLHIAKEQKFTPLQTEQQAQEFFAKEKQKNFIGQEATLNRVLNYINDNNNTPLIIYGKSGSGKSALMAKAIFKAKEQSNKKIIYRFVGATANTTSSKEVLTSIFEELGINLNTNKQIDIKDIQNQESFEDFSYRIYDEFLNIKDEVVIFIDAVDQLVNLDQFLWLPKKLPKNVKIVISALNDKAYKEDSQYFKTLKSKTKNLIEIKEFDKPLELLYKLLNQENRTLQKHQEEYFLQQYQNVKSPLYVVIVAQELKHWKSFDAINEPKTLANTQKGAIKEFINNLSQFHHHDKDFVKRVLGYIYASRDGLSESEILQLISVDEEFLEQVAPSTYHENKSGELPVVIWARLYTQLKPFLSKKTQDSEELLYFFHREFEEIISKDKEQKEIHQKIIEATQELIKEYQYDDFYSNRWGILYSIIVPQYQLLHKDKKQFKKYSEFIAFLTNKEWINDFINKLFENGFRYYNYNKMYEAIACGENLLHISKKLYKQEPNIWVEIYEIALINLASSYANNNKVDKAIKLEEESLEIVKKLYSQNPKRWIEDYTRVLNNLALSYSSNNKIYEAIKLQKENLNIIKKLYNQNKERWAEAYTTALINLASSYANYNKMDEAIKLEEESLTIREKLYNQNPNIWTEKYIIALINLATSYYYHNKIEITIKLLETSLELTEKLYNQNPDKWAEIYTITLINLASSYKNNNKIEDAIKLEKESLKIREKLYNQNPDRWVVDYTIALINLASSYKNNNKMGDAIKLEKESLEIREKLYNQNPEIWAESYIIAINNLASSYSNSNKIDKAIKLQEKSLRLIKKLYSQNQERWIELYTTTLNNLASSYYYSNRIDKTIELFKKNLYIIKKLYNKNQKRWVEDYIVALINLASTYKKIYRIDKAIKLEEESLEITKKLYNQNKERWAEDYTISLNNLALSYSDDNKIDKAIKLQEESLEITEKLYNQNHNRWAEAYKTTLTNLTSSYIKTGIEDKTIELFKKLLNIYKKYYGEKSKETMEIENILMHLFKE